MPVLRVVRVRVVGVADEVGGEDVDCEAVPADARPGDALGHEDLAVKVPQAAAGRERPEWKEEYCRLFRMGERDLLCVM